jgi:hypothetical protein
MSKVARTEGRQSLAEGFDRDFAILFLAVGM